MRAVPGTKTLPCALSTLILARVSAASRTCMSAGPYPNRRLPSTSSWRRAIPAADWATSMCPPRTASASMPSVSSTSRTSSIESKSADWKARTLSTPVRRAEPTGPSGSSMTARSTASAKRARLPGMSVESHPPLRPEAP